LNTGILKEHWDNLEIPLSGKAQTGGAVAQAGRTVNTVFVLRFEKLLLRVLLT
jgi:hypothetical protein